MSEKIQPALSAEEWASFHKDIAQRKGIVGPDGAPLNTIPVASLRFDGATSAVAIAKGNALLPDSDPRKITRIQINALRFAAAALREKGDALLDRGISPGIQNSQAKTVDGLADALESYLPLEA